MGVIGLGTDEFRQMSIDEFDAVAKAYREVREQEYHDGWERMRVHASICVQPHVRKRVTPKTLLRLPWDGGEKKPVAEDPGREEAMKQYNDLITRLEQSGQIKKQRHGKT